MIYTTLLLARDKITQPYMRLSQLIPCVLFGILAKQQWNSKAKVRDCLNDMKLLIMTFEVQL